MGACKVLKNYLMQLFVQNMWSFASEQKPGITLVLSARSRRKMVIRPPQSTFNTNPYLASFLTGVLVREQRQEGKEGTSSLLESSLAAQGDDLYWRVLRPTALLAGMLLVVAAQPLIGILIFLLGFNLFAQGQRLIGHVRGLKRGRKALRDVLASLARLKRILLPLAGAVVGLFCAAIVFNLDTSGFLLRQGWFVFVPLFAVSLVFAFLRISPLFNLLGNLLIVVVLGIFL